MTRCASAVAVFVVGSLLGGCTVRVTPAGVRFAFVGDDLVVDVPAGSVDHEVALTAIGIPEPAGTNTVPNTAFAVVPVDGWAEPVSVTLAYAPADLPRGVDEAELVMMRKVGSVWAPLSGSRVDPVAHTVSAALSTLGSLAIGWVGCDRRSPSTCTLREAAAAVGLRVGTIIEPAQLTDDAYTTVVNREFTALTPENALKMYSIENQRGVWTFAGADAVVDYAVAHGLAVRGHTLVWAQDRFTPAWVAGITDAAELKAVTAEYIDTVVRRYAGRVARWDVVNEPLSAYGTGPSGSVWDDLLGSTWIAEAFRTAHAADPSAELWLNEYGTDWVPGKHAALLALVTALVRDGVPIHGVGIQTHRPSTAGPDPVVFSRQLADFTGLGLKVAITELDVPTAPTDASAAMAQAGAYGRVAAACLAVPDCVEITTWGLGDDDTWLDSLGVFPTPTRPLLFDESRAPKAAYRTVVTVLCGGRPS